MLKKQTKSLRIMYKLFSAAIFIAFLQGGLQAQTCDNPTSLCGDELTQITEFALSDFIGQTIDSCLTGNQVSVLKFHTTYINSDQGVDVYISGLECSGAELHMIVVEFSLLDPCNTSLYTAVSECVTTTEDVTFTTESLYTNTDYLILISYGTEVIETPCELSVEVSGEPLSIIACCPTNIPFLASADLEVLGGDGGLGYVWSPEEYIDNPSSYSVTVTPPVTTSFEVSGFVEQCEYSDNVLVVVGIDVDVPNAFSPNGDSYNDTWKITGLPSYTRSLITLYDRWGQEVFRSIGYPFAWDGKMQGKDVPAGTYYYVIDLNEPGVNLEPIVGNVAIIR